MNPYLMPRSIATYAAIVARWRGSGMAPEEYARSLGLAYARATVCLHLSVLRQHYRDLMARGEATANPWHDIKPPRPESARPDAILIRSLSPQECLVLRDYILGPSPGPRDACAMGLMLFGALRVSEAESLTWDRISPDSMTVTGKGNKTRAVRILPALANLLARIKGGEGNSRARVIGISKRSIQESTDKHLTILGLKRPGVSCHSLRHSWATMALIGGASVEAVRSSLGHSSIATTQVYISAASHYMENPSLAFERVMVRQNELTNDIGRTSPEARLPAKGR